MRRVLAAVIIFFVGAGLGFIMAHGPLNAQETESGDIDIMPKLNEIAKSQQELIVAIKAIREDIQIIKLRITQMQ